MPLVQTSLTLSGAVCGVSNLQCLFILTLLFGVHDPAPHGGFLVLPVVDGGLKWVLAILIGAVVGGILFVAFKAYEYRKNGNQIVEG